MSCITSAISLVRFSASSKLNNSIIRGTGARVSCGGDAGTESWILQEGSWKARFKFRDAPPPLNLRLDSSLALNVSDNAVDLVSGIHLPRSRNIVNETNH